ncbi:MAG: excinuclease ABC subunit UvrC [Planctomycetota bacterium]|nr:excinuclease ABC subunit UvrC [Planctomycetota bacterium]
MDLKSFREVVSRMPDLPGVYVFKAPSGEVLYVGKASSLKKRLSSYLKGEGKSAMMVEETASVQHEVMDTEVEALLREADMIKKLKPKYNVLLKDDKSFPLIAITKEVFPAVLITRDRSIDAQYYGPFPEVRELRRAVDALQKVFLFRRECKIKVESDGRVVKQRPCLLYHIRRCSAPCAGFVGKEDYAQQIKDFKSFLAGGRRAVIGEFKRRMHEAAKEKRFEEAARIRNQINALSRIKDVLEGVDEELSVSYPAEKALDELMNLMGLKSRPHLIEGVDVAALQGTDAVGAVVTFVDGEPFKEFYHRYRIRSARPKEDPAMIGEVVFRRFARKKREEAPIPSILLVDGGVGQLLSAKHALERAQLAPDVLCALAKGEEELRILGRVESIFLERTSAALKLLQFVRDEAHRFAQLYHKTLRRKRTFGEQR